MLNPIIQKVANLINDDIDPALRRVYEDIVLDLEKVREALLQPIEPGDVQEDTAEDDSQTDLFTTGATAGSAAEALPIGQDIPLGLSKPAQPAPLPGTGGTAAIPPVGEPVQEFQPQPGAGETESLLDTPSTPVAASELADGTPTGVGIPLGLASAQPADGVSELVGNLQAAHDAAKADGEPVGGADPAAAPAPETPAPEPVADPIV